MSEFLLRFREAVSAAHALILMAAALLLFHFAPPLAQHPASTAAPLEVTLVMPEIQPPPHQAALAPPAASPAPPRKVAPLAAQPSPAMENLTAGALPAVPPAQASAAPTVAPPAPPLAAAAPPPSDSAHTAEAVYVGKLRAYLHSIKRYPSGREASQQRPAGIATIWFTLRRSGELVEAGIETSAASMLLDNAALSTVRRGAYPAFPDEAWAGKAQQRFTVELDFVPK